jgi:hypothetical protein
MRVKENYFKLKEQWIQSQGPERDKAQRELDAFFKSLNEEEKELVNEAVAEDFVRIHKKIDEAKELKKQIEIRTALAETLPFISVSELAKQYFGKSASWLHQRINGNEIHGKAAAFTGEELNTLAHALKDVAGKLNQAAARFAL